MKQSTVQNYTNPRPIYNCPHFAAWGLATRLAKPGLHNLRLGFMPPEVEGIALQPVDANAALADGDDDFTTEMFMPGGTFHETQLNHYVKLRPWRSQDTFMVNAGYLLNHFVISDMLGYKEYKRLANVAKSQEDSTKAIPSTETTSSL